MNTKQATALAALTFVLAACSGETSSAPTVAATPVAVSETFSETTSESSTDEEDTPTAEVTEDVSETESVYGERIVSERGNLSKELGQLAAMAHPENGKPLVEFTVTKIETGFTCTTDWAEPSMNGDFIAVSMEFQTTPELADWDSSGLWLSHHDFKIIGPDGTRENDPVGNGIYCITDGEEVPDSIGPSETVKGMFVFDSQYTEGALVFQPSGAESGWEWIF